MNKHVYYKLYKLERLAIGQSIKKHCTTTITNGRREGGRD
jgi:hypothetical protein